MRAGWQKLQDKESYVSKTTKMKGAVEAQETRDNGLIRDFFNDKALMAKLQTGRPLNKQQQARYSQVMETILRSGSVVRIMAIRIKKGMPSRRPKRTRMTAKRIRARR